MKKYLVIALTAIFLVNLSVLAQNVKPFQKKDNEKRPPREMQTTPKDRAEKMAKQLSLTVEQTAKVQALFEKQNAKRAEQREMNQKKLEEMKQTLNNKREEMNAQREAEKKVQEAELEKIIGKEKMSQWNAIRQERQALMQQNMQRRQNKMEKKRGMMMKNDSVCGNSEHNNGPFLKEN